MATAPVEQGIRTALQRNIDQWPEDNGQRELATAIDKFARPLSYRPLPQHDWKEWGTRALNTEIWDDLRPNEAVRLNELVAEARKRASERVRAIVFDELVAAGLQFAAEYPAAPRGKPEAA